MGTSWSTVKYRQGNAKDEHRLWEEPIASNIVKEDLGVRVDEKLDLSQQCAPTAQKAQTHPELNPKQCGQQVKGGDSPPLLHIHETPPGVLHPLPGSSA